jgi:hypothetical protein
MRSFLAGIILLLLPALAIAQVSGDVESIGFDSYFRPDCWTPMVITVTPETAQTDFYQIHVKVQDLDRDLPIFQRTISVTGTSEGQNRQQKFRMYFIPPPTDGGLPDARDPGALKDLQDRLKVSLHNSAGKWICDLPLTGTLNNVDPKTNAFDVRRGSKLIVAVSDGQSRPIYHDNTVSPLLGVMEDTIFVTVHPRDLPENVLGYDAADAILWLNADPAELKAGGDEKFRALQSYVHRGGRLIISQPAEWQKISALDELLPVTIQSVDQKDDLLPLSAMAKPVSSLDALTTSPNPFAVLKPPFRFARATPKNNAIVSDWIDWSEKDRSPYVVRMPIGLGSVTWIAQDLGDPSLTRTKNGWVYVWDHIFDWKNSPLVVTSQTPDSAKRMFELGGPMDLGASLLGTWLELQSKSAWLITLAILFFIGYWLLAGPGVFVYLHARKKTEASWFIFGACALAATAITLLIVKLVLRGPPELKHFSIVRMASNQPTEIISRMGLYIPRDGMQKIELKDAAVDQVTEISALPIHPTFLHDAPDQTGPEYSVPVIDAASGQAANISVPYRSTLKKFQATWIGDNPNGISGVAKLADTPTFITGHLTNATGSPLKNIYLAFHYPGEGSSDADFLLYFRSWDNGITLDLAKEFTTTEDGKKLLQGFLQNNPPDGHRKVLGRINTDWETYWTTGLTGQNFEETFDDSNSAFRRSLIMLSLFDRLAPIRNDRPTPTRVELFRRGGRSMDLSDSLAAGSLLIFAESQGPLPMPLNVEGEPVKGDGLIFYQFVLPLDRGELTPTTQQ